MSQVSWGSDKAEMSLVTWKGSYLCREHMKSMCTERRMSNAKHRWYGFSFVAWRRPSALKTLTPDMLCLFNPLVKNEQWGIASFRITFCKRSEYNSPMHCISLSSFYHCVAVCCCCVPLKCNHCPITGVLEAMSVIRKGKKRPEWRAYKKTVT